MNVIDFKEGRRTILRKRYAPHMRTLSRFTEYCVIPGYDELLDYERIDRVQVDDVRVHLAKVEERYLLASILFEQSAFTLDEILEWLERFNIILEKECRLEHEIANAVEFEAGLTFSGQPLVKYRKGNSNIFYWPEIFDEVLECFDTGEGEWIDFETAEYGIGDE